LGKQAGATRNAENARGRAELSNAEEASSACPTLLMTTRLEGSPAQAREPLHVLPMDKQARNGRTAGGIEQIPL